jgi:hypothetical protein
VLVEKAAGNRWPADQIRYSSGFFALAVCSVAVHEISSVNPRAFFAMSEVFSSPLVSVAVW